jgi:hypothetical protein
MAADLRTRHRSTTAGRRTTIESFNWQCCDDRLNSGWLPLSECAIRPASGRLSPFAISSASSTSSVRMWG